MRPQTAKRLREYHHWMGLFFAPAIIFFAVSGALQTFRLQEVKGWGATPPRWIVWVASVHIDQTLPKATQAKKPAAGPAKPKANLEQSARQPLPLKIFVVLFAAGLTISAVLGISIALSNARTRRNAAVILAGGSVLPLGLLLL